MGKIMFNGRDYSPAGSGGVTYTLSKDSDNLILTGSDGSKSSVKTGVDAWETVFEGNQTVGGSRPPWYLQSSEIKYATKIRIYYYLDGSNGSGYCYEQPFIGRMYSSFIGSKYIPLAGDDNTIHFVLIDDNYADSEVEIAYEYGFGLPNGSLEVVESSVTITKIEIVR